MDEKNLKVIDTDEVLTLEEVRELKKIAALPNTIRFFFVALGWVITGIGIPMLLYYMQKHNLFN